MSTFVLVHGGWHGAWCWERITPRLQAARHRVVAVDLPGHGDDRRPVGDITLQAYADTVLSAVDRADEPVVLVGWSMGGIVVSTAAEQHPDRNARLVYLAAFMLPRGVSVLEFIQTTPEYHGISKEHKYLIFEQAEGIIRVAPEGVRELWLHDATDEDVAWVTGRLHHEYLAPVATPVRVSAKRWGSIPRTYIETLHDQHFPVAAQRKMQRLSPGATVHSLPTGHSPFITRPNETADLLLAAAEAREFA